MSFRYYYTGQENQALENSILVLDSRINTIASAVNNSISKSSPEVLANVQMNNYILSNLGPGIYSNHSINKSQLDSLQTYTENNLSAIAGSLLNKYDKTGGNINGDILLYGSLKTYGQNRIIPNTGNLTIYDSNLPEAQQKPGIFFTNQNHGIIRDYNGGEYHTRVYTAGSAGKVLLSAKNDISQGLYADQVELSPTSLLVKVPLEAPNVNITGNAIILGNLDILGTSTTINSVNSNLADNMVRLASNNTTNDLVDIGVFAPHYKNSQIHYSGWYRKYNSRNFKFFETRELPNGLQVNEAGQGYGLCNIEVDSLKSNTTETTTIQNAGNINLSSGSTSYIFSQNEANFSGKPIKNIGNAVNNNDALTLGQFNSSNLFLPLTGGTITGQLLINNTLKASSVVSQVLTSTAGSLTLALADTNLTIFNNKIQLTENLNTLYGDMMVGSGNILSGANDNSINFYNSSKSELLAFIDPQQLFVNGSRITMVGDPFVGSDGVNKNYVDNNFYNKTYIDATYPIGILNNITLTEDGIIPNFNSSIGKIVISTPSTAGILTRLNFGANSMPDNHKCEIWNKTSETIYLNYMRTGSGHIKGSVYSYIAPYGFIVVIFDSTTGTFRLANDRLDNYENKLYLYPLRNNFNSAYLHLPSQNLTNISIKFALQFRGTNDDNQTINGITFIGVSSTTNPFNLKILYAGEVDVNYTGSISYYNYGASLPSSVLSDTTLRDNFTGMIYQVSTLTFTIKNLTQGKYYMIVLPYFVWDDNSFSEIRRAHYEVLDGLDNIEITKREVNQRVFAKNITSSCVGHLSVYCWRQENGQNKKFRIHNLAGMHIYSAWCYDLGYNPL